MGKTRILLALGLTALALVPAAASATPGDVAFVRTDAHLPSDAVLGPDGAIWMIGGGNQSLARLTEPDLIEVFPLDATEPRRMVLGPDDNFWITGSESDTVVRFDPESHAQTSFPTTGVDRPFGVAEGPDGNLWITGSGNATVGRVDPATGAVTAFPATGVSTPIDITSASDGNLWIAGFGNDTIGRVTPATGAVTAFASTGVNDPAGITAGPGGTLWLTGGTNDTVGKVTLATGAVTAFPATGVDAPTRIISAGGALWVTGFLNDTVGRVNASTGAVTAFPATGVDQPGTLLQVDADRIIVGGENTDTVSFVAMATGAVLSTVPTVGVDLPQGIVQSPDGDIWVLAFAGDRLVRIDGVTRAVTPFLLPGIDGPHEIAVGPDGNLWITGRASNTIARVVPASGAVSVFPTTGISNPRGVAAGPDGNVWIVGRDNDSIGRVVPSTGVVTPFSMAPTVDSPRQIAAGPDGNLYVAGAGNDTVARVTTAGVATVINTDIDGPIGITVGPDDRLWVTGANDDSITRMELDGSESDSRSILTGDSNPINVNVGPDGNLWVAAQNSNRVVRVTPFFGMTSRVVSPQVDGPVDLVSGPGQRMWISGELDDSVATLEAFADPGFGDVPANAFFQDGVEWAKTWALVNGFNDGTYRPNDSVLRGQIVNMLFHLVDEPPGSPAHGFADVPTNAFFRLGLNWAKAEGLVNGFPGNLYKPNDPVNRGQLVNMLWNMVGRPGGSPSHGFVDVPANAFFGDALDWARAQGLVSGFAGNRYKPTDPVKRGQVASILYNLARNPAAWEAFTDDLPRTLLIEGQIRGPAS